MYAFARTPKWLLAHALALAFAVACAGLGLWQLDRLSQRREFNARLEERAGRPAEPAATLFAADAEEIAYRRVTVTGRYDVEREMILRGRAHEGRPGNRVLTPLRVPGAPAIVVDRGWVPFELDDPPIAQATPPDGEVRVTGILVPEEPASSFGPRNAPESAPVLGRLELAKVAARLPYPVRPLFLRLETQTPSQVLALPVPVPLASLGEGPHLGYAIQWFAFGLLGLGTYVVLLRRTARRRLGGQRVAAE